jgi:competence protein ComEA
VNYGVVKKITFMDMVMGLGLILMVVGLGIKMRGAEVVTTENKFIKVEKTDKPIAVIININTASITELDALPSIGPVTAQKIIDYRNRYGLFKSKEGIKNVSGIGEKTYEKIKDKIEI